MEHIVLRIEKERLEILRHFDISCLCKSLEAIIAIVMLMTLLVLYAATIPSFALLQLDHTTMVLGALKVISALFVIVLRRFRPCYRAQ